MHITNSKALSTIFYPILKGAEWLGIHHPKLLIKLRYLLRFKRFPNLGTPKDLNEKILYQKLFSDTKVWSVLADKYSVREYIKSCGLEEILVPLYGVWDDAKKMKFDGLPNQFILKANNGDGKGNYFIVKDKSQCRTDEIINLAEKWLTRKNIGALAAEPQYSSIPPKVVAEELLVPSNGSLVDYKIWCFNGKPHSFLTCSDRKDGKVSLGAYDLDWNYIDGAMISSKDYPTADILPKPKNIDEMIRIASTLSKPFPQVRVDLYNIDGKIYFGELTFTSLGGMMNYYTPNFLLEMGSRVDLTYRPCN